MTHQTAKPACHLATPGYTAKTTKVICPADLLTNIDLVSGSDGDVFVINRKAQLVALTRAGHSARIQ